MSLQPVEPGELAAVVTYLEMRERPADLSVPPSTLRLDRRTDVTPAAYRDLFRLVGAPWLWFSRLIASDDELATLLSGDVALWVVVDPDGNNCGMIELDYRTAGECELGFIGLVPSLAGRGHGRWLLAEATDRAWRPGITRIHVHTCTLDHPAAIAAYRRAGFVPIKRAIERFADPRLLGVLPPDCAPQVPLLGTPGATTRSA